MNGWEEKAWGRTRCTHTSPLYSRHELELVAGGYSSLHWHRRRANRFTVTTGRVRVVACYAWTAVGLILNAGNTIDVRSRVPHQFQVLDAGTMVEEYYPDDGDCEEGDIMRLTTGGVTNPKALVRCEGVVLEPRLFTAADLRFRQPVTVEWEV